MYNFTSGKYFFFQANILSEPVFITIMFIIFILLATASYLFLKRDIYFKKGLPKPRKKKRAVSLGTEEKDPGETHSGVHYDYSFTARLHEAPEETKVRYTHLKNYILSFSGVKSKITWSDENFYSNNKLVIKMRIHGRSIRIFYALTMDDIQVDQFPIRMLDRDGEHAETPMLLKVRGTFALGAAREITNLLFDKLNVPQATYVSKTTTIPFIGFNELLDKKLIRKITNAPDIEERVEVKPSELNEIQLIPFTKSDEQIVEQKPITKHNPETDKPFTGEIVNIRYNYSYKARLIMATEANKNRYNELKNLILSYANVKASMTWKEESFIFNGKTIIKFRISGNSLRIYLALDPTTITEKKYNIEDLSNVKEHLLTPSLIKVRGSRGLMYAKQLIGKVFTNIGAGKGFDLRLDEDYRLPLQTQEQLLANNLIKVVNARFKID